MEKRSDIFRFKQFAVSNSRSAMRVGTDGVLLGAWAEGGHECRNVWDVGAGTGLIALMLAQRMANISITAIEIDDEAAGECRHNAEMSPWGNRITTVCGDIADVCDSLPKPDLIVSNPPFFYSGEHAPARSRAMARHADAGSLGPLRLIDISRRLLNDGGRMCMITPADMEDKLLFEATLARLDVDMLTEVCPRPGRRPLRLLWRFSKGGGLGSRSQICIRNNETAFSDEYRLLTKDFYLDI